MPKWQNKNKNKSKMGKRDLNPTDAFRKKLRDKEKKRNKLERRQVREEALLRKNPKLIKEELDKLNHLALMGQLDVNGSKRREKLELMWEIVRKKLHAEKVARTAQLDGLNLEAEETEKAPKVDTAKEAIDSDSSAGSSVDSDSSDSESKDATEADEPLSSAPPLPPGLPPNISALVHNNKPLLQHPTTNTFESKASSSTHTASAIPTDFTQLINLDKPILPPPPPPLTPELFATNDSNDSILTVAPPLPPGPPPPSTLPNRTPEIPVEGSPFVSMTGGLPLRPSMPMMPHPYGFTGAPTPSMYLPIYPYHGAPYMPDASLLPPAMHRAVIPPMAPPVTNERYKSMHELQERTAEAPAVGTTLSQSATTSSLGSSALNATPAPPPPTPRALFVPTQLRIRNKASEKPKYASHKVSSINQVTAFSTGIHRAETPPLSGEVVTLNSYIERSAHASGNRLKREATREGRLQSQSNKSQNKSDLDQAFNDFLKEVEHV